MSTVTVRGSLQMRVKSEGFQIFFTLNLTLPSMTHTTTASGLQFVDTVLGTGAIAKAGQNVSVHYTGWLFNDGVQGAKFDSSKDRGQPFQFSLGAGQVI